MQNSYDVVCLSHLRWDFVYQRPQHLLGRFARTHRVFFVEEPIVLADGECQARLEITEPMPGVTVIVPRLDPWVRGRQADEIQRLLLDNLFVERSIQEFVLWYYTPMALGFTRGLPSPLATVYDCMDELSAFRGAPPDLLRREAELFQRADVVFTGGHTLYEAKRHQHAHVFAFPSSVDVEHFATARSRQADPVDQAALAHPRLGFCGVLDERFDTALVAGVADLRPDWQLVLLGPVAKIDPATLPRRANIHYLGGKTYAQLPAYLAGWDVALITFARNESTRFISPTKTPEYLAAGLPVVSTSIRDVIQPYGAEQLCRIADTAQEFVAAAEAAMHEAAPERLARVDRLLGSMSWDRTWAAMEELLNDAIVRRLSRLPQPAAVAA